MFWIVEFPRKYYLTGMSFTDGPHVSRVLRQEAHLQQPLFWFLGCAGLIWRTVLVRPPGTKLRYYVLVLCAFCTVVPGSAS